MSISAGSLIDLLPTLILLVGRDGLVLHANRAFETELGHRRAELAGRSLAEIVATPPDELAGYLRRCAGSLRSVVPAALAFRTANGGTVRLRCDGGTSLTEEGLPGPILLRCSPHRQAVAEFAILTERVEQLGAEIRRRQRVEDALRESEARFRATFEQAAVGAAHVAPDGAWLRVNGRLRAMLGYTEAELLAKAFQDVTHPDDLPADLDALRRLLAGETATYAREKRYLRKDGATLWADLTVSLLRDETGAPLHFITVVQDISARKAAEMALAEGEAQLRDLLATLDLGAFMACDLDGTIRFWSAGSERLYGWSAAEAVGRDAHELLRTTFPVPRGEIEAALERDGAWSGDLRQRTRDGTEIVVAARKALRRGPDGQPAALLESLTDVTAQRRAEAALGASETRLRAAVEGSPFPIMLHAEDGEVLALSRSWTELSGYRPEEIPTHCAWFRLAYPDRQEEIAALLEKEFAARAVVRSGEQSVRTRSGAERVWDFQAVPLGRLPDGRQLQMSAALDVTERRRAEEGLRRQLRLTEAITDNAAAALFIMDERQHCVFMNPAAERLTGFRLQEMRGRSLHDVIHHTRPDGSHFPLEECPIDRAFPERMRMQGEEVFVHKDGHFYPVAFTASPIVEDGGPVGTVLEAQDITERKRAEAALRESERRYRELVEALDVAVYTTDAEGRLTAYNEAAAVLWGWHPPLGDTRWCGSWRLFWPDGRPMRHDECPMAVALRENRPIRGAEAVAERPDGGRVPFIPYPRPLRDANGALVGAVNVLVDITERKAAEAALARHRDELERLVEERTAALLRAAEERRRAEETARQSEKLAALGQLTGGVAHDFNNLLQVVTSGAALLQRPSLPEAKRAKILEGMIQAGRSARDLTGRLLAFARRQTLHPEVIDIGACLAGMSELLRQTLGSRIRVETEIAPGLWSVCADPSQLEVAILNLALNARDAMPKDGTLTLRARNAALEASAERAAGEYVCIAVEDTGEGMPPHVLAHVLEPFFTTKGPGQGTGLGLSQAHGFAKQSGGDLQIESELGRGTVVSFHLPRAMASASAEDEGPGAVDDRRVHVLQGIGTTVLVVEDNPDVAAFACSLLEELGYATRRAGSAAVALAMLADGEAVDAVFSDVVMPGGISGVELAAALRSIHPRVAVVLATGYSEQLARGGAPEGVEVLAKPYHPEELTAALGRALARSRSVRELAQ
jgi:PAS domain S-box-containing protein